MIFNFKLLQFYDRRRTDSPLRSSCCRAYEDFRIEDYMARLLCTYAGFCVVELTARINFDGYLIHVLDNKSEVNLSRPPAGRILKFDIA